MPGILPMKVIKIGANAQTRIAQACDRCRSKKIRCDGVRPCCTQCANVGFECKTSDKLSRRAFPRGYTESLEERVRSLEAEVRELKDLLDERDEKIDMLSRIHSRSSQPIHVSSPRRPSESSQESQHDDFAQGFDEPDEIFKVKQSSLLQGTGQDSYFAGTSSSRSFFESFRQRAKDHGFDVSVDGLCSSESLVSTHPGSPASWIAPPRLLSDQLVNVFFQEWAPLFPVLHRPAFLTVYERYVASPEAVTERAELAHLNLVFSIAALSSGTAEEEVESMESQWRAAVDSIMNDNTIQTLQALVLAQIYCLQKGDLSRLLTYKGLSTTLSARLGLHQVQKTFALDVLTAETRKKLFWTLYTVDCLGSVVLGLPKHIKDDEVSCEYPVDADDEYITEKGFQPSLPGESTKLSSGRALFQATRILSRVLEEVFPAKGTYELSLKKLSDLSDELELWEASLPSHLRLHFAQDKPSTGTITSRSPILSFTYHYIRALIQRPAICSKALGKKASSALMIHAESCKRMVQIFELLNERAMGFSFCLDKNEVLLLAGAGLLLQRMELDAASKTSKDNQKTIASIAELLVQNDAACADIFKDMVHAVLPELEFTHAVAVPRARRPSKPSMSRSSSDKVLLTEQASQLQASTRKQLKAIASRFSQVAKLQAQRRSLDVQPPDSTVQLSTSPSLSNGLSMSPLSDGSLHLSQSPPDTVVSRISAYKPKRPAPLATNLDYLSFGNEPTQGSVAKDMARPIKSEPSPTDWERLLGNLDNGITNIFDASYGGPAIEALADPLLDFDKRSSAAVGDALACDTGLFALQPKKPDQESPIDSMRGSFSSEDSTGGLEHYAVDWISLESPGNQDTITTLMLADFDAEFDIDLGIDWQEGLASSM